LELYPSDQVSTKHGALPGPFALEDLTWVQAWLERAVDRALPRLAAAVRPVLGRVARPRARLLRHAVRLVGDGAPDGSIGESVALAAVGSEYVTLASGFERLPAFLHLVEADDRLEVLTLLAGFDGRAARDELAAVGRAAGAYARGRDDLRVVDVPGELGMAVGVLSHLPGTAATTLVRGVMEAHLDVARAVAGVGVRTGAMA
jgi:hypothetical protein